MLKLAVLALVAAYAYGRIIVSSAEYYDRPEHMRRAMMGTRMDGNSFSQDHEVKEHDEEEAGRAFSSLPDSFIAGKDKWPQCSQVISFIKDQAACGSCWAVSASEVVADRECIHCSEGSSNSTVNTNGIHQAPGGEPVPPEDASAEDIMSCCTYCGDGCQGGYPIDAMKYWCETGVPSGGWYHSQCGCNTYKVDPTSHTMANTPQCQKQCDDPNYPVSMANDRRKCTKYYAVRGESTIMQEIYTNGPVECAFTVYKSFEDFFREAGNAQKVYINPHKWFDQKMGGHAIKTIGWGTMNGQKYWEINNSWNTTWADKGRFKFQKGGDLDGMESGCVAAIPACNLKGNKKSTTLQCKGRDY